MRIVIYSLSILLVSCSLLPTSLDTPHLTWLAPAEFKQSVHQVFNLKISQGKQQQQFLCVVEISAEKFTIVGLSGFGQRLFSAVYDGEDVVVSHTKKIGNILSVKQLLLYLQLIYQPVIEKKQKRLFYQANKILLTIDYTKKNEITLINHQKNYQLVFTK